MFEIVIDWALRMFKFDYFMVLRELITLILLYVQDGYAVVASDGPGEYPVITESRAGNDGIGVTVTPGTIAYVTTGGEFVDVD